MAETSYIVSSITTQFLYAFFPKCILKCVSHLSIHQLAAAFIFKTMQQI